MRVAQRADARLELVLLVAPRPRLARVDREHVAHLLDGDAQLLRRRFDRLELGHRVRELPPVEARVGEARVGRRVAAALRLADDLRGLFVAAHRLVVPLPRRLGRARLGLDRRHGIDAGEQALLVRALGRLPLLVLVEPLEPAIVAPDRALVDEDRVGDVARAHAAQPVEADVAARLRRLLGEPVERLAEVGHARVGRVLARLELRVDRVEVAPRVDTPVGVDAGRGLDARPADGGRPVVVLALLFRVEPPGGGIVRVLGADVLLLVLLLLLLVALVVEVVVVVVVVEAAAAAVGEAAAPRQRVGAGEAVEQVERRAALRPLLPGRAHLALARLQRLPLGAEAAPAAGQRVGAVVVTHRLVELVHAEAVDNDGEAEDRRRLAADGVPADDVGQEHVALGRGGGQALLGLPVFTQRVDHLGQLGGEHVVGEPPVLERRGEPRFHRRVDDVAPDVELAARGVDVGPLARGHRGQPLRVGVELRLQRHELVPAHCAQVGDQPDQGRVGPSERVPPRRGRAARGRAGAQRGHRRHGRADRRDGRDACRPGVAGSDRVAGAGRSGRGCARRGPTRLRVAPRGASPRVGRCAPGWRVDLVGAVAHVAQARVAQRPLDVVEAVFVGRVVGVVGVGHAPSPASVRAGGGRGRGSGSGVGHRTLVCRCGSGCVSLSSCTVPIRVPDPGGVKPAHILEKRAPPRARGASPPRVLG